MVGLFLEKIEIGAQRVQFDYISRLLIELIHVFGTDQDTLYVQHCPMPFSNEGAGWISQENFIRNPYFGDVMLKCGLITDTLFSK